MSHIETYLKFILFKYGTYMQYIHTEVFAINFVYAVTALCFVLSYFQKCNKTIITIGQFKQYGFIKR